MHNFVYLENTTDNHNKYYLIVNGHYNIKCYYGIIRKNVRFAEYNHIEKTFMKLYNEKLNKGYNKANIPLNLFDQYVPISKIVNKMKKTLETYQDKMNRSEVQNVNSAITELYQGYSLNNDVINKIDTIFTKYINKYPKQVDF